MARKTYNSITTDSIKKYYKSMNEIDKKLHLNIDYFEDRNFISIDNDKKTVLNKTTDVVKLLLSPFMYISKINYKIHFFIDDNIEYGLPHTHGNTIFLPYKSFFRRNLHQQSELIIHELIHIYQRYYPIHTHKLLFNTWNLNIYSTRNFFKYKDDIRCNPDLNNIMYHSKKLYYEIYQSDNVNTLKDTILQREYVTSNNDKNIHEDDKYDKMLNEFDKYHNINVQKEHPFEVMACLLAYYIANDKLHTDYEIHKWCKSYL